MNSSTNQPVPSTSSSPAAIGHMIGGQSVTVRNYGLVITSKMPFERWHRIGQEIFGIANASTWWIADWLVYGETKFHDRYREAIQNSALAYQTLRNYAWVARRFEISRRRENLTFGHHAETAALGIPEQDYWLRKAEEYGWSRNDLRKEIRTSLRERGVKTRPAGDEVLSGSDPGTAQSRLLLNLTRDQVERFRKLAAAANIKVEDWALQILEQAALSPDFDVR